jgi:hypothetical protein
MKTRLTKVKVGGSGLERIKEILFPMKPIMLPNFIQPPLFHKI